ncbi:MAG: GLPGLI family protein [Chitinophagaceae bacterium]|nr:GLPGLI family protein [Chitinophagaceae bacterium]MCB9045540.1 GLPGLI family protein [Chitinophagales bacterium]
MRQFILLFTVLLAATAQAQQSGTITYEERIELNIELEGEMAQFAAMLPKERKHDKLLYFTKSASLYKNGEQPKEDNASMNNNGMQINFNVTEPDNMLYKDLKEGTTTEQKEFMGREFLINGSMKKYTWKMTGKQKEIAGYPCQEATTIREEDTVTAWFTPAIPISTGPGTLGNLPGMILEAHIGNMLHITTKKIELGEVDKSLLSKPKNGKKVTAEKFDEIVAEKTKDMKEQYGDAGGARIMIRSEVH